MDRSERIAGDGHPWLARMLADVPAGEVPLTHVARLPARRAQYSPWPLWAPSELTSALAAHGVNRPWRHQVEAAELAFSGHDVVIATGTASGKSLAYQLPVLTALLTTRKSSALYLAPTKALAADQLAAIGRLQLAGVRAARFDGDTPSNERDWVRAHSNWIFSNPDMLHCGMLGFHPRFEGFWRGLRYVVIDECHSYRGLFGSHVALLLRRLRRVAAHYRARPVFVLASATASEPGASARQLIGAECAAVTADHSPRGARTLALWEPPLQPSLRGENGAPVRRTAGAEAARMLADLVVEGARTLVFVRSRHGCEHAAMYARDLLASSTPELARRVASYRAGYLPEDRRALERALLAGSLLGVVSTNALELGVDIAGLDAVVIAGYPGTLASFWQQAGRAGRAGSDALVVFIARDDPMDTYLVHHPAAMLNRPLETTVTDPTNPSVLAGHLVCAAAEIPMTERDLDSFGGQQAAEVLDELVAGAMLRRRPAGWYPVAGARPHAAVDIRGACGDQIAIVESDTARMLGTVDPVAACWQVHPGAVYLHQGSSYVVDNLDLDTGLAMVHAAEPEWTTSPRDVVDIGIVKTIERTDHGFGVTSCLGEVDVTSQVVGYLRRLRSGEVLDTVPLDLPERTLRTRAVWYTIGADLLRAEPTTHDGRAPGGAGLAPARVPGALHAAEHAAIGLLPLFATCDRWDVGGVSTAMHEDTGEATVFVHDGHPGGAGFADRGFTALIPWLAATREAVAACECPAGCPSCVQSPKCGNGNEPLDKAGAVAVLDAVLPLLRVPGAKHNQVPSFSIRYDDDNA